MSRQSRLRIERCAKYFFESKRRWLEALMIPPFLLALGSGPDRPSSPDLVSPLTGSNVGQKAPHFTAVDQFGQKVTSDSLKGPNGTVLLFFRSADW